MFSRSWIASLPAFFPTFISQHTRSSYTCEILIKEQKKIFSTVPLFISTIWEGITLHCFSSFIPSCSVCGCLRLLRFSWVISFHQETLLACVMDIISGPKGYIPLSGHNRNRWTENTIILGKRLTSSGTVRLKIEMYKKHVLYFIFSWMYLVKVHINWHFLCNPCKIITLLRHCCLWLYPTQFVSPYSVQNMCLNTSFRVSTLALSSTMSCDSAILSTR